MRRLGILVAFLTWLGTPLHAEVTKTILNQWTGRPDFITAITTNTIRAGSNVTVSSTSSGVTISATSSGSAGGGIVSPGTETWVNNFGMQMSTLTVTSMNSGSVLFSSTSGKLFQDNSTFFWDDSKQFLGIGTNSPNHTLHIRASPNTTPLRIAYDDDIYMDVTQGGAVFAMDVTGSSSFRLSNGTVGNSILVKSNGDNVLNEEGSAGFNRFIVNSGGVGFRAGDLSDTNYIDYKSGGVLSAFTASGVRPLSFGTNGIDTLFISGTQLVGIGTSTPATLLHISSGTFTIDGNVSPAITIVGSGAPPNSQALCLLSGSLGHCTTVVGVTGGCTCSVP